MLLPACCGVCARPRGSGAGNTLIGAMPGDSRETTMTINDPQTVANEKS